ncbi:MAG TPA: glycosyltransferase family 4 protein [Candidatus Acidoferrales bacterium]|nr:glycosyltransferase family 4 protein [Candidatus Acidoferrales bacterium]
MLKGVDIAIIHPHFDVVSGAEKLVLNDIAHFAENNGVTIYTSGYDQSIPKLFDVAMNDITIVDKRLPHQFGRQTNFNFFVDFFYYAYCSDKNLVTGKHDISLAYSVPSHYAKQDEIAHFWYCQEPIRSLYDTFGDTPAMKNAFLKHFIPHLRSFMVKIDKERATRCKYIFTNSNYTSNYVREIYTLPSSVIYPGIDLGSYYCADPEGDIVLTVARLVPEKRIDVLIEAMSIVNAIYPTVVLKVVGNGPEKSKLIGLSNDLGVNVEFVERVDDVSLRKLYASCFAVAYVPRREPFGYVPIEAMASRKPVIGINEGGIGETILHGKTGILTDGGATQVASAMIELLNDRSMAAKMGSEGLKRSKIFSNAERFKRFDELLVGCLNA